MAEEAKNVLAQMELEDEEMLEELEEEGCLLDYHLQGQVSVLESDEENFPEIEEIEDVTDEDEGEEEVKRRKRKEASKVEVSAPRKSYQLITYQKGQVKGKCKGKKKASELCKEITDKGAVL